MVQESSMMRLDGRVREGTAVTRMLHLTAKLIWMRLPLLDSWMLHMYIDGVIELYDYL